VLLLDMSEESSITEVALLARAYKLSILLNTLKLCHHPFVKYLF
jgi:hypothetical protein